MRKILCRRVSSEAVGVLESPGWGRKKGSAEERKNRIRGVVDGAERRKEKGRRNGEGKGREKEISVLGWSEKGRMTKAGRKERRNRRVGKGREKRW